MSTDTTKKLTKLTVEEVARRTKARVDFPAGYHRNFLCGSPVETDPQGNTFAIIPGYATHVQQLRELHPTWIVSDPYVDMED